MSNKTQQKLSVFLKSSWGQKEHSWLSQLLTSVLARSQVSNIFNLFLIEGYLSIFLTESEASSTVPSTAKET